MQGRIESADRALRINGPGTDTTITAEQVTYYETFGFLLVKQAFNPDEMAAVRREFDDLLNQERQGQPFPGLKR